MANNTNTTIIFPDFLYKYGTSTIFVPAVECCVAVNNSATNNIIVIKIEIRYFKIISLIS